MFVKQHRLPYESLERMFNNEITAVDLAKLVAVNAATVANWKKYGIPEPQADRVAVKLGLHPASVWGDAWWSLAHMSPLRDSGTCTDSVATGSA